MHWAAKVNFDVPLLKRGSSTHSVAYIDTKRSLRAGVRQDTSRLTEDYRKIGHLIPTGPEATGGSMVRRRGGRRFCEREALPSDRCTANW